MWALLFPDSGRKRAQVAWKRLAFAVAPIAFGLDKFFDVMVHWPRYGAYVIALRDFGLMLGALTLARLASVYDPPIELRRRA